MYTATYLSLHGCVVGCSQNSHAHAIINALVSKIHRACTQAMRTDIRTQHCVSALRRQDKKRIMSTFLGLMLLLPAATTSPTLKNTSHELSIVSELRGTKYQYCKYRYRYW